MKFLVLVVFSFFLLGFADLAVADEVDKTSFSEVYKKYNELVAEGEFKDALEYASLAYDLGEREFGVADAQTGMLGFNLGFVLNRNHENKKAEDTLKKALGIFELKFKPDAPEFVDIYMELGVANVGMLKERKAETYFLKAIKAAEKYLGEESPFLVELNMEIGNSFIRNFPRSSARFFKRSYDIGAKVFTEPDYRFGLAAFSNGKVEASKGRKIQAEKYYLEALETLSIAPPPNAKTIMVIHTFLVQLYSDWGEDEKATEHIIAVGKILGDRQIHGTEALYQTHPRFPSVTREGYVIVEFTIDSHGFVKDPTIFETTSGSFSRSALDAIINWRYAPRVVDGVPVDTEGVKYRFIFKFAEK